MEVVDEFDEIMKELVEKNPWVGSVAERTTKFAEFHQQLCNLTKLQVIFKPVVEDSVSKWEHSSNSLVDITLTESGVQYMIVIAGRLSVLTMLFLWQRILSIEHSTFVFDYFEIFQKYWPEKAAKLKYFNKEGMYYR